MRYKNNGHYYPENCRWATKEQQLNNRGGQFLKVGESKQQEITINN